MPILEAFSNIFDMVSFSTICEAILFIASLCMLIIVFVFPYRTFFRAVVNFFFKEVNEDSNSDEMNYGGDSNA